MAYFFYNEEITEIVAHYWDKKKTEVELQAICPLFALCVCDMF